MFGTKYAQGVKFMSRALPNAYMASVRERVTGAIESACERIIPRGISSAPSEGRNALWITLNQVYHADDIYICMYIYIYMYT